jgi:DNA-binding transcriptional regulator YiaG
VKNKYKNEALEALYATVSSLHKLGLISDEDMRRYDEGCLAKPAAAVTRLPAQNPIPSPASP